MFKTTLQVDLNILGITIFSSHAKHFFKKIIFQDLYFLSKL